MTRTDQKIPRGLLITGPTYRHPEILIQRNFRKPLVYIQTKNISTKFEQEILRNDPESLILVVLADDVRRSFRIIRSAW